MARALPLADTLKDWLEHTLAQVSAKSGLGKAIRYALGNWPALVRYCEDGRIEIDNNTAERSIRPLVLGRRNYLFAGSDGGGQSAAVIYSLIGTARLNGIEPYAYLRTVFERIAEHPINRIDALLPWHLMPVEQPFQQAAWLDGLTKAVGKQPGALAKTVFELPAVNRESQRPVEAGVLRAQMKRLNAAGVVHLGYGPDDFIANRPDTTVLRDVMSVQGTLRSNQGMLG